MINHTQWIDGTPYLIAGLMCLIIVLFIGITPSTALRLSKFFGNSLDFWLNLQNAWELYHAQAAEAEQLERIKPLANVTGNNN